MSLRTNCYLLKYTCFFQLSAYMGTWAPVYFRSCTDHAHLTPQPLLALQGFFNTLHYCTIIYFCVTTLMFV